MKIDAIGGSSRIGSKLVEKLRRAGHDPLAASPDSGVDTNTGKGLEQALQAKGMAWFWDAYLPEVDRRSEPFASPLRASDNPVGSCVALFDRDGVLHPARRTAQRLSEAAGSHSNGTPRNQPLGPTRDSLRAGT